MLCEVVDEGERIGLGLRRRLLLFFGKRGEAEAAFGAGTEPRQRGTLFLNEGVEVVELVDLLVVHFHSHRAGRLINLFEPTADVDLRSLVPRHELLRKQVTVLGTLLVFLGAAARTASTCYHLRGNEVSLEQ